MAGAGVAGTASGPCGGLGEGLEAVDRSECSPRLSDSTVEECGTEPWVPSGPGFLGAPMLTLVIAKLQCTVIDCPDPVALARFYAGILGGRVDDVERAQAEVIALGATFLYDSGGERSGFRVFSDPAGHPFCLCYGQS
ncbi:hypothetical protein SPAR_20118 [Streptomyces sparsogenes DSM 40356]|uniref:Glyoxalase-like domain-containing protein n=1 Tax=Streptomyces sparsogenes DSM 40356 TaxID=1331668 RepID=A0A1R1SHA1_9ACTN|nr:hypothetical protein SPAR_20118 [Streptomyces sparsogenes DSM 40356]